MSFVKIEWSTGDQKEVGKIQNDDESGGHSDIYSHLENRSVLKIQKLEDLIIYVTFGGTFSEIRSSLGLRCALGCPALCKQYVRATEWNNQDPEHVWQMCSGSVPGPNIDVPTEIYIKSESP